MSLLSWILFWPDSNNRMFLFHVFRHICIICLLSLATSINPSVFTIYLVLLTMIEYSRRCSTPNLIFFFITFTFGCWFAGYINMPFVLKSAPKTVIYDFLRSIFLLLAIIIDRLTSKRFGFTSHVTAVFFPIIIAGCAEILSVIDHLGITTHLTAFCNDFPDFTFLPLRLLGPGFVIMLVAFLVSYTSRWRVTRANPKAISFFAFQFLPVSILFVFLYKFITKKDSVLANIGVINNYNTSNIFEHLNRIPSTINFVVIVLPLINMNASIHNSIQIISVQKNIYVIYSVQTGNNSFIYSSTPNGLFFREIIGYQKSRIPMRILLRDMLVFDSPFGRIGAISGREMFYPEYICSKDVDLMITFGGQSYDEGCNLAHRSARMISQITGATRFHASSYDITYAINGEGEFLYKDFPTIETFPIRSFNIPIKKNRVQYSGYRIIAFGIITNILFGFVILYNIIPMKYIYNINALFYLIFSKLARSKKMIP